MPPSDMHAELASQPGCWRKVATMAEEVGTLLEGTGGRMAMVGCGTSYWIAGAAGRLREEAGLGASDVFPASEVPTGRRYPWLLAVSRTGTTTEVIRAVKAFSSEAGKLVITADGSSPLAKLADRLVVLDFANERSVVQTRFATSALSVMRAQLGHDLEDLATSAEGAISEALPAGIEKTKRFVFVGSGWAAALAGEAALKMTEAAGASCQHYPALEVRHGPMSAVNGSTLVWCLGGIDASLEAELRDTGAMLAGGQRDAMVELVAVQRAAERLARAGGRDPDAPPRLGRSVVLP